MTRPLVDRIADAVLYEGYLLYPYRPSSVKNRQRWTFGGLFPQECDLVRIGAEPSALQAECLIEATEAATVRVRVRFLHLIERSVGGRPWQEAEDREIPVPPLAFENCSSRTEFALPIRQERGGRGEEVREQLAIRGAIDARISRVEPGLFRLTVGVANLTAVQDPALDRECLLRESLVSTHVILETEGGGFISQTDPPEQHREAVSGCKNVGVWPVLIDERKTMLASPIILPDHPQLAPESPGDLFDATEIDEILTLRILTLTDQEKAEMRAADPRADALLARTESLGQEQLMRLHGTVRELRRLPGDGESM